jgi:phosphohistidine phosphatase SixA
MFRCFTAAAFAGLAALAAPAAADEAGWTALTAPGTHALMRHATAPGTGDPQGFRIGDCKTQRNLDAAGRAQAARIGAAVRDRGIAIATVLTSQWCRARDTADLLGLAPVEAEPALNSFFDDRGSAEVASRAVVQRLSGLGEGKAVAVTHQVNITALTGIFPASGEIIVVAPAADGSLAVRGRIRTD